MDQKGATVTSRPHKIDVKRNSLKARPNINSKEKYFHSTRPKTSFFHRGILSQAMRAIKIELVITSDLDRISFVP